MNDPGRLTDVHFGERGCSGVEVIDAYERIRVKLRGSGWLLIGLGACMPTPVTSELDVGGGDLVVSVFARRTGEVEFLSRADRDPSILADGTTLDVHTVHFPRASLRDIRGNEISEADFQAIQPVLAKDLHDTCGCQVPSLDPPQILVAGDTCPIPEWAEGRLWVDGTSRVEEPALAQTIKAQLRLRVPGDCGCSLPDPDSRLNFDVCPTGPLEGLWAPSRVAVDHLGNVALISDQTTMVYAEESKRLLFRWHPERPEQLNLVTPLPNGCGFLVAWDPLAESSARYGRLDFQGDLQPESALPGSFYALHATSLPDGSSLLVGYGFRSQTRGPAAYRCTADDSCMLDCLPDQMPTCSGAGEDRPERIQMVATYGLSGRAYGGTNLGRGLLRHPDGQWVCAPKSFPERGNPGAERVLESTALAASVTSSSGVSMLALIGSDDQRNRMLLAGRIADRDFEPDENLGLELVLEGDAPSSASDAVGVGREVLITTGIGTLIRVSEDGSVRTDRSGHPFRPEGSSFDQVVRASPWTAGIHATGEVMRVKDGDVPEVLHGTSEWENKIARFAPLRSEAAVLQFLGNRVSKWTVTPNADVCTEFRSAARMDGLPSGVAAEPVTLDPPEMLDGSGVDAVASLEGDTWALLGRDGEGVFLLTASLVGTTLRGERVRLARENGEPVVSRVKAAVSPREDVLLVLLSEGEVLEVDLLGRARQIRPSGGEMFSLSAAGGVGWLSGRETLGRLTPESGHFRFESKWVSDLGIDAAPPPYGRGAPIEVWDVRAGCANRVSATVLDFPSRNDGSTATVEVSYDTQPLGVSCDVPLAGGSRSSLMQLCATPGFGGGRGRYGITRGFSVGRFPFTYAYEDGVVMRPGGSLARTTTHFRSGAAVGFESQVVFLSGEHGATYVVLPSR